MKNAPRPILAVSLRVEVQDFARVVELPSEFSMEVNNLKSSSAIHTRALEKSSLRRRKLTLLAGRHWCCKRFPRFHPWQPRRGRPYRLHKSEHLDGATNLFIYSNSVKSIRECGNWLHECSEWGAGWLVRATTNCFRPRHEKFHLNQYARHSARKNGFMKAEIKIKHFCLLSRERLERKILNKIMLWRRKGEGDGVGEGRERRLHLTLNESWLLMVSPSLFRALQA